LKSTYCVWILYHYCLVHGISLGCIFFFSRSLFDSMNICQKVEIMALLLGLWFSFLLAWIILQLVCCKTVKYDEILLSFEGRVDKYTTLSSIQISKKLLYVMILRYESNCDLAYFVENIMNNFMRCTFKEPCTWMQVFTKCF
jgi:hypothetical protein